MSPPKGILGLEGVWRSGEGHIFKTTFTRHIQFCILTRNEKENSSDTADIRTDCIHLTIIPNQCCVRTSRHSDTRSILIKIRII